jgi:hypothetical protein
MSCCTLRLPLVFRLEDIPALVTSRCNSNHRILPHLILPSFPAACSILATLVYVISIFNGYFRILKGNWIYGNHDRSQIQIAFAASFRYHDVHPLSGNTNFQKRYRKPKTNPAKWFYKWAYLFNGRLSPFDRTEPHLWAPMISFRWETQRSRSRKKKGPESYMNGLWTVNNGL